MSTTSARTFSRLAGRGGDEGGDGEAARRVLFTDGLTAALGTADLVVCNTHQR